MSIDRRPGVTRTNESWPQFVQAAIAPLHDGDRFNNKYIALFDPRYEEPDLLPPYSDDPSLQASPEEIIPIRGVLLNMKCIEPIIPEGAKSIQSYKKMFDPRDSKNGVQDCKGCHYAKSGTVGCLMNLAALQKRG